MRDQDDSFKSQFENELEEVGEVDILSPEFRRKKLMLWALRSLVALVLYIAFWKYAWVRWTLAVYIPLTLISLVSIYGWRYLIKRKVNNIEKNIAETEKLINESEENEPNN